ncbi:MAG: hypothetical protein ACYC9X_10870, partial [Dehalococcoidia bacterium]
MKKIALAVAALTVALAGFGSLTAPTAQAAPASVWVVNANVATAVLGTPVTWTAAGIRPYLASLAAVQTASGGLISSDTANAGSTYAVVQTNGSASPVVLNGKGLVCTPACDGVTSITPAMVSGSVLAVFQVNGNGSFASGNTVTVIQDSISVDSIPLKTVLAVHNVALTVSKKTVQAGAATCPVPAPPSTPANGAATMTYTDIAGNALVGYAPTFKTSSAATVAIGNVGASLTTTTQPLTTMVQSDGKTIAAVDSYCGVAAGTANVTATTTAPEATVLLGSAQTAGFVSSQTITVTGPPANIALTASPASVVCDGTSSSTVTAKVTDSAGNNVVDGTGVTFSVVALGTANPISTTTTGGAASSVITPLAGVTSGVVVTVTSGAAAASILVACQPAPATAAVTIAHAASDGTSTTFQAKGVGAPNTVYRVDFFWNPTCNPATPGGTYIAAFDDTADASGTFTLNAIVGVFVPPGAIVTATITGPDHIASPFAPCAAVVPRQCTDDSVCN